MKKYLLAKGFTLIELLIVISILGILAALVLVAMGNVRNKAQDTRLMNDLRQIKWLAEIVYNGQNQSFLNWSSETDIQDELTIVLADIDDALGTSGQTIMVDSEVQDYCVSVPLRSSSSKYYCTDRTSGVKLVSGSCPTVAPIVCPS